MNFQKFKTDSYCVGGRRKSAKTKVYGDISSKCRKILIGYCLKCNRKKSMSVVDNTIQAEGLGDFFKNQGKKELDVSKKMAQNVFKKPGRALDITAKFAAAVASRNPKNLLKTLPEVINIYRTESGFYLGKFV